MQEITLNNKDLLIMNLVHYFVTEKNYNPIILHGIEDEVWLENMNGDYRVVRIVGHYIHNNEQLKYDKFKVKQIIKKLKVKTLSLSLNTLTIYTDLGDSVSLTKDKYSNSVYVNNMENINNNTLIEIFPDIVEKTNYKEEGIELFVKITEDMNKNNLEKSTKLGKIFQTRRPVITYTIMSLCILAFLMMYILGGGSENVATLIMFGANYKELVVNHHEYYRVFTCMFLHIGIAHLFANMYSLYILGPQVENFFGKWKYLFIYLISGICGSLLTLGFSNSVSAGASGAIFGLMGALLYFGYHYRVYLSNALVNQLLPVIFVNLGISLIIPSISLSAHVGGLVGGIISSMVVGVPEEKNNADRINGIITLTIYLGFIIYLGFFR